MCMQGDSAEQEQRDQLVDSSMSGEMTVACTGQQCLWKMKSGWRGKRQGSLDSLDVGFQGEAGTRMPEGRLGFGKPSSRTVLKREMFGLRIVM